MLPDDLDEMLESMMFSFGAIRQYLSDCESNDDTPSAVGLLYYCQNQTDIGAFCVDNRTGEVTPIDEDFNLANKTIQ